MFCLSENIEILQYVAALALYDGCFSMRPRRYEVIIADMNREFLEKICHDLKNIGISCGVYSSKRDKAYRLRIYGKDTVQQLSKLAINLLRNPNDVLLAAAIDAEGNIGMYRNQPFRTRIVMKEGEKLNAVREALKKLGINYKEYMHCRKRGQCSYKVIVISGKEENMKIHTQVRFRHPDKQKKLSLLFNSYSKSLNP